MEKKILLICVNNQNFLVSAMGKKIEEAGYSVEYSTPDTKLIQARADCPDIFLIYLEGDLEGFENVLKYARKEIQAGEKDKAVYIIGTQLELNLAYDVIPQSLLAGSFLRPFNVSDIISKLNSITDTGNSLSKKDMKKILVVDDDPLTLRTMNNWLNKKYEVYMANSGQNAVTLLQQKEVDLILLDYEMPGLSGSEVFRMIKADFNTSLIPIIFLTSKSDKETVMKLLSLKPEKYLLKTLPPEELVGSIDNFFKNR